MFKSVMEGEADDIVKSRLYTFEDRNYLVMVEYVYQVTSKEGGRGITTITGHNDQRISVYNLEDGSRVARKKTGRNDRYAMEFLGCTPGNLWFYSFENGLHTLDPLSLEIKLTQENILRNNPELLGNLATCEWYQLPQYFQFNELSGKVILTDNKGYRYALDPITLIARKIEGEYRSFDPRRDRQLETHISFPPPYMALTGDLRKQVRLDNQEVNTQLTFLDGKFIVDRNPVRVLAGINQRLSAEMVKLEGIYSQLNRLNSLNGGRGPLWRTPQRDTLTKLENSMRIIESTIKTLEEASTEVSGGGFSHSYNHLLSPDSTSFFVLHASGTAKDANMMISRVHREGNISLKELWTTEIPGLFHNPDAARETNTFKEVFSKGSPEFRYSHFEMEGNKLIIVWMLHGCCLDTETGKILWKFRI